MHSLFSRSRTFSTPSKNKHADDQHDEFGRIAGRQTPSSTRKKDKKKGKEAKRSATPIHIEHDLAAQFPDGSFLPLNLERPSLPAEGKEKDHDYGYLCYERHVVLGLDQLERLVDVLSNELETRGGITTPFIFNNTALDINPSGIKRLVHSFIDACAAQNDHQALVADQKWKEEARFAGPHELGMCLRWGLARVIRSVGGQDVRGLVSWDHYCEWRDSEAAMQYPPAHFQTFLPDLPPPLQFIIVRLLSLLARLIANSTSSGHTPPTLSPLFGPLFFGLGPPTLAFHHAYMHYLRATNAMEHIILAFIRWQDAPRATSAGGSASALGVPMRLQEWIKGYPGTLTFLQNPKAKPQPRKGSKTVRVVSVRRNVRMYSADLVKSASTWGQKTPSSQIHNAFALSKEWERIAPPSLKLPPRYSESYKKKMNLPNSFHPDVPPAYSPETAPPLSLSSTLSSMDSSTSEYFGVSKSERPPEKFRSLTDLKWGEFEDMGFDNNKTEEKLRFDLTESARQERKSKRQTLDWNDFSTSGFSRMDAPLSATLQFSTPVVQTVTTWPAQQAEIHRKLKKQQKALPAFGWDTEPVVGTEEVVEAGFVDCFVDLVYGGGWMDLERGEGVDRECNWALVEYKSLPATSRLPTSVPPGTDPRTDTTLLLFEEFVPLEYRQQLALPPKARRRLPSLFSSSTSKSKQWKQAATLNGRPYVVGAVPASPSFREVEFEGMLARREGTKQISLSGSTSGKQQQQLGVPGQHELNIPPPPSRPAPAPTSRLDTRARSPGQTLDPLPRPPHDLSPTTTTKKSRFRIPVPSPSARRSMLVPSEYSTIEFQTRMASYSDDDDDSTSSLHHPGEDGDNAREREEERQKRRASRSDAWVDILVSTQSRRMEDQAAALSPNRDGERRAAARVKVTSDPDGASLEVAQVLAAVQQGRRSVSPPPGSYGEQGGRHGYEDYDVDEVETVPRSTVIPDIDDDEVSHIAYDREPSDGEGEDVDSVLSSILSARQAAREKRGGYFDLHPERRPVSTTEDPRARFGRDEESEDEDEVQQSQVEARRPLRALPVPPQPVVEPLAPKRVVPAIKVTTNLTPSTTSSAPAPPPKRGSPEATTPDGGSRTPTKGVVGSKTAALIEMYRERERTGSVPQTSSSSVAPLNVVPASSATSTSRLPVRSVVKDKAVPPIPAPSLSSPASSLSKSPSPTPSPPLAVPTPPLAPRANSTSPKPVVAAPVPEPAVLGPPVPTFVVEETGRVSPARYVHGAPLHNVIEEEEEEE